MPLLVPFFESKMLITVDISWVRHHFWWILCQSIRGIRLRLDYFLWLGLPREKPQVLKGYEKRERKKNRPSKYLEFKGFKTSHSNNAPPPTSQNLDTKARKQIELHVPCVVFIFIFCFQYCTSWKHQENISCLSMFIFFFQHVHLLLKPLSHFLPSQNNDEDISYRSRHPATTWPSTCDEFIALVLVERWIRNEFLIGIFTSKQLKNWWNMKLMKLL